MCGRFTLVSNPAKLKLQFGIDDLHDFMPHYNITPGQSVLTLCETEESKWDPIWLRWGLIPFWAKDPGIGNKLTNARAETVANKPAFRQSFRTKRALLLMSGFFEWRQEGSHKQPYYFKMADDNLLAVAALWDSWQSIDGAMIHTCCLITTTANDLMKPIHNRMPVILSPDVQHKWTNNNTSQNECLSLLTPYKLDDLVTYPVTLKMNNSNYQQPDTILPATLSKG